MAVVVGTELGSNSVSLKSLSLSNVASRGSQRPIMAVCKYYKSHNPHRQFAIDIGDEDGILICVGVA